MLGFQGAALKPIPRPWPSVAVGEFQLPCRLRTWPARTRPDPGLGSHDGEMVVSWGSIGPTKPAGRRFRASSGHRGHWQCRPMWRVCAR